MKLRKFTNIQISKFYTCIGQNQSKSIQTFRIMCENFNFWLSTFENVDFFVFRS